MLGPAPSASGADAVGLVLSSRVVVFAVRLAVVFAAGYVVVSVVALIANRRWLVQVGPAQVDEDVSGLVSESTALRVALTDAEKRLERLRRKSAQTTRLSASIDASEKEAGE